MLFDNLNSLKFDVIKTFLQTESFRYRLNESPVSFEHTWNFSSSFKKRHLAYRIEYKFANQKEEWEILYQVEKISNHVCGLKIGKGERSNWKSWGKKSFKNQQSSLEKKCIELGVSPMK